MPSGFFVDTEQLGTANDQPPLLLPASQRQAENSKEGHKLKEVMPKLRRYAAEPRQPGISKYTSDDEVEMERKTIAVMQPYFFPYAGYFRLFASVDQFVIFDCVQFPRRGRVHRSQVPGPSDSEEWLTLPIERQPIDALIRDLKFAHHARETFDLRLSRFRWIEDGRGPVAQIVREFLYQPLESMPQYLESSLQLVTRLLALEVPLTRSSTLSIDHRLRGQERVIAIAKALDATHYVNLPGGRSLYDHVAFAKSGLALCFLPPYTGRFVHILPSLMREEPVEITNDIVANSRLDHIS